MAATLQRAANCGLQWPLPEGMSDKQLSERMFPADASKPVNEAVWSRLEAFNQKLFQKREGSRASSFAEERPFLRSLPPRPFELATWKVATVGPNYHIAVERMNDSVPFEYIKQKVDVRLTKTTVEANFFIFV